MKKEYAFVTLSGIFSGLIIFLGRVMSNAGMSLFEMSTIPYALTLIFLLPWIFLKKFRIQKQHLGLLILYGILGGFLVFSQFGAVILGAPVATIVLLLYTQPLWTILFSKMFMKEQVTKITWIACGMVLLGIVILVDPFTPGALAINWGFLLALIGGVLLSLWVIIGRVCSTRGSHPIATKYGEILFMIIFLALVFPLFKPLIGDPTITGFSFSWPLLIWGVILLFNLFTQTIGHVLFYIGVKKVPASSAGIIMLLEPVSAAILASLFLAEPLTYSILLGGVLILAANYLIIKNGQGGEVPH